MVEFYQLEQLLRVADCGTLSGAAEELHLSQPALSRSMQRLENDIGVPLFIRYKNKIELNENGRLAVEYAEKIVDQMSDMIHGIRDYDRKRHTIFVGSCAPAPLWELLPALSDQYPDMTVASELRENDALIQGLKDGTYHLVLLPFQMEIAGTRCHPYGEEHLFFSLPPAHPLSGSQSLQFKDLNGDTMLLRSRLGFWKHVTEEKMPDTRFLVQNDADFDELVKASALPSFTSDRVIQREGEFPNRIKIPIEDTEANVVYSLYYRLKDQKFLANYLRTVL
ncbi:LysR family transcriptional regulator [Megasphaera massiliensis]|uniref:LysR family transcriptional regulator n=1 Tax=Megasphaera massiliensis TaxID=1232428 RepID=UPI000412F87F|nr:LysR family transcriptional regulator [Megasphaera massiliensis]MBS6255826.1 LysR family transcriptional regulator [Megasphaera sp.]